MRKKNILLKSYGLENDQIGHFVFTTPFTEIENFVTRKMVTPRLIISKNIDRDIHLFINFVTIPDYRGGWNYFYLQKVLLRLSSLVKFSQNLTWNEDDSSSTTS